MKAVRLDRFGDASVLALAEVEEPVAGEGEVLIDVDAAGVNFGDLLVREGKYMGRDALPVVPGWEVVGRDSSGQRVVALLGGNGYAERVAAPLKDTVPVPDDISDQVALAMVIQGVTAWHLLEVPQTVVSGESVLITGAGSGVTHLVVQMARLRSAGRIVVMASSEAKARRAVELGADLAVRTDLPGDAREQVLAALGGDGADALIDMVGAPLFDQMLRCLRPGGRAVIYGIAGGEPSKIHTGALLKYGLTVTGLWLGHGGLEPLSVTIGRLFDLCRSGELMPTLGPTLPLADAAEAHRLVEAREGVGKVCLKV